METIIVRKGFMWDSYHGGFLPCLKSSDPILNHMPLRGNRETVTIDAATMIAEMNKVRAANGKPLIVLVK